ncbi:MAG: ATP-dependent zinc protease [Venatoribacter sp.]
MTKPILGFIEKVQFPNFDLTCYAKVDTGACTSSLHANQIEPFNRNGKRWVRFYVQFNNEQHALDQVCEAPVVARRVIASSNGQRTSRYIIQAIVRIAGQEWPIEVSLSNRGSMKYPMLLGRNAISGRFLVDVSITTSV